ncbi:hypothetical protein EA473_03675 [Natrarchaeobius chitinivorans]|uniref:Uncharacterized protein n=1 Tax=Natrarchaeobius chitinivorans TaxID=1679083 RepID=A0A3N6NE82_NATCH|nr:hypothetical protein EA473_03675 [Natrarchaeobius chitinivorans]
MEYSPRYRLFPTIEQRESLDWTRDIVRQLRSGSLRRHACEDCDRCGHSLCVCKSRLSREPRQAVRRSLTTSLKQETPASRKPHQRLSRQG